MLEPVSVPDFELIELWAFYFHRVLVLFAILRGLGSDLMRQGALTALQKVLRVPGLVTAYLGHAQIVEFQWLTGPFLLQSQVFGREGGGSLNLRSRFQACSRLNCWCHPVHTLRERDLNIVFSNGGYVPLPRVLRCCSRHDLVYFLDHTFDIIAWLELFNGDLWKARPLGKFWCLIPSRTA